MEVGKPIMKVDVTFYNRYLRADFSHDTATEEPFYSFGLRLDDVDSDRIFEDLKEIGPEARTKLSEALMAKRRMGHANTPFRMNLVENALGAITSVSQRIPFIRTPLRSLPQRTEASQE